MDVREKLVEILGEFLLWPSKMKNVWMPQGIEKLADYLISNGVTVQSWIPVTERLPEEKVDCIVHYKHAYCNNDGYWAIGFCFYDGEKFQLDQAYKVTHWMPTPQPPKGE